MKHSEGFIAHLLAFHPPVQEVLALDVNDGISKQGAFTPHAHVDKRSSQPKAGLKLFADSVVANPKSRKKPRRGQEEQPDAEVL